MTRGHPPRVAIAEAMRYAPWFGFLVVAVNAPWLPCDFMTIRQGHVALVRVRRVRYGRYSTADISTSCSQEISELRDIPIAGEAGRELWVRGPDRQWHRYVIHPDRIEAVQEKIQLIRPGRRRCRPGERIGDWEPASRTSPVRTECERTGLFYMPFSL